MGLSGSKSSAQKEIEILVDTEEVSIGSKEYRMVRKIVGLLPKINIPFQKFVSDDYPRLEISALEMIGYDYHLDREVFVIGEVAFFRRYSDVSHDVVMNSDHMGIWQSGGVSYQFLVTLYVLIEEKGPHDITNEEIMAMLETSRIVPTNI